ncbi:MAG: DUF4931 domain-containing protein [Planctomycetes bacterium]|nr:DUF4931 domain-containing protein [Planctomycetota bacterium]
MNDAASGPRLLVDPTTGRPILMAPQRQQRPMHTGAHKVARPCPFCRGNEHETPPTTDSITDCEGAWFARSFTNKYPANEHHEVIAEGPAHHDQPGDLDSASLRAAIELWQLRVRSIEERPGVACTYLFKNVGALAGASIEHNHSQILGLAALPPRVELERAQTSTLARCPWCATIATAERDGRLVFASRDHVVLTPDPPKLPHETWLLPRACDDDFLETDADSLAAAMHALFTAVARGLHRPAFNMWLHRVPGECFHWHFELQPRTGQMAGLELGGDMYINSYPAAASAEKLRNGLSAS